MIAIGRPPFDDTGSCTRTAVFKQVPRSAAIRVGLHDDALGQVLLAQLKYQSFTRYTAGPI
jgi:hypothetical protein